MGLEVQAVHLWVEDFFELFVTVVVAVLFYRLGAVSIATAKRVIYLDAILYLMGWYPRLRPSLVLHRPVEPNNGNRR